MKTYKWKFLARLFKNDEPDEMGFVRRDIIVDFLKQSLERVADKAREEGWQSGYLQGKEDKLKI